MKFSSYISNFDKKEFKKFLVKLLYFLPLAAFLGFPFVICYFSGEMFSVDTLLHRQQRAKSETLVGLVYTNPQNLFKLRAANKFKPDVLILGTSRVMQFREQFFQSSFYNAGGGITNLLDLDVFLNKLEYNPKIIILGLDQNLFNSNWDDLSAPRNVYNDVDTIQILRKIDIAYKDYFQRNISLPALMASRHFGFLAILGGDGFRQDGSYRYGRVMSHPEESHDFNFKDTFSRIDNGERRLEYAEHVNMKALPVLDAFLANCKKRGIEVVGFLPPYANTVWAKMQSTGKYGYLDELPHLATKSFKDHGFDFFTYNSLADIGGTDQEALDGIHGSEKSYLRILRNMTLHSLLVQGHAKSAAELERLQTAAQSHRFSIVPETDFKL